jgi:hypothetical protein
MKTRHHLALLPVSLVLAGCGTFAGIEGIRVTPTLTVTAIPDSIPEMPVTAVPLTPGPHECQPNPDLALRLDETSLNLWDEEIVRFILQGGEPARIHQAPATSPDLKLEINAFDELDFNGDSVHDLLLTAAYGWPTGQGQQGGMLFFECLSGSYALAKAIFADVGWGPPSVIHAGDMNLDHRDDVLVIQEHCGAHTCSQRVQFLTRSGDAVENRFIGTPEELPFPIVQVERPAVDGRFEISVTGRGYGSAGAGPYRERTQIYAWSQDEQAYLLSSDSLAAPVFRIHMLHDADSALLSGDYAAALAGYGRVIDDDVLNEWTGGEAERRALEAFAFYRIILTQLALDDASRAKAGFEIMRGAYEMSASSAAYVSLSAEMLEAFMRTNDLSESCRHIEGYVMDHEQALVTPLYFGYGNPTYTAADICPF